jgi:quercetin dioxygenase-like cupin family protein
MAKCNLFETSRFFCDLYCLEPGQSQKPHAHAGEDKAMVVLEGAGRVLVGDEARTLTAGQAVLARAGELHGLSNEGPERLVVLVFMAPHPKPKEK